MVTYEAFFRSLYCNNEGLMLRYIQAGVASLIRVHSCYAESGIIRKSSRFVPVSALRGIFLIDHITINNRVMFCMDQNAALAITTCDLALQL